MAGLASKMCASYTAAEQVAKRCRLDCNKVLQEIGQKIDAGEEDEGVVAQMQIS